MNSTFLISRAVYDLGIGITVGPSRGGQASFCGEGSLSDTVAEVLMKDSSVSFSDPIKALSWDDESRFCD